jgi:hypothetical protein
MAGIDVPIEISVECEVCGQELDWLARSSEQAQFGVYIQVEPGHVCPKMEDVNAVPKS